MGDNQEPNEDLGLYIGAGIAGIKFGIGALFLTFLYGFFVMNLGVVGAISHALDEWYVMFGLGAVLGVGLFLNNAT